MKFNVRFNSRVTILKNENRKSKGVAFVQFLKPDDAEACTTIDNTEVGHREIVREIPFDSMFHFRCLAEPSKRALPKTMDEAVSSLKSEFSTGR